jgi:hypothetical protein
MGWAVIIIIIIIKYIVGALNKKNKTGTMPSGQVTAGSILHQEEQGHPHFTSAGCVAA